MIAGLFGLAGCSGLMLAPSDLGVPETELVAPQSESVPRNIQPVEGELASATGCRINYRLYRPADAPSSAQESRLVVLGHGFLRSQQRMTGLAQTIAAAGIPVATLDFCNMRFWDGRHQQNGLDMIALARHLGAGAGADVGLSRTDRPAAVLADGSEAGPRRVIYAGFSAGALAALVAARNDPTALGAVTLDLVDAQGIGERAARELDKPLIGLAGEPTNCNANDNAGAVFAATQQGRLMSIAGAGHCDFEAPTDALCELVCADPDRADGDRTAELREQIRIQTLAAIEALMDASVGSSDPTAMPAAG